jgi:uncharacterized protein DUF3987/DNA primase RepB-like protein
MTNPAVTPTPDLAQARAFLARLDPESDEFTLQTFDDTSHKRPRAAKVHQADVRNGALEKLASWNQHGAGIFVTVNATDGYGRQTHNIRHVRALFVDLDGAPLGPILSAPLSPHIVVESSPRRYHAYWLCDDCPLDAFERAQRALAGKFSGDPSVHDLPRVMRLPGFVHRKGEPFLSHMLPETGFTGPAYPYAEIVATLELDVHTAPGVHARARLLSSDKVGQGHRHEHLFAAGRSLAKRGLAPEAVRAALVEENAARCEPPLSDIDVAYLAERAFTAKDALAWGPANAAAARASAIPVEPASWPEIQPLPNVLAPVDAFDSELLPDCLRAWVDDISERVQCPPDFVGVAAVTALAAVLGRKVAIRPQARTDWTEVANQWALVIGRPGVLKSPAIEQAMSPLRRLEAVARERYKEEKKAFRVDVVAAKLRAKANEQDAEKAIKKDRHADVSGFLGDDDGTEPPTCHRYATSDPSVEALAELVRMNPNGVLVHRDEMVSLLRDLDREERAAARGFYLTGWNGNTSYTVDRIERGADLHIPAVCLSLLGGTQPARIASYVHVAIRGGSSDDGLIQRFGLMVWPDLSGEWRNVDRWPETQAKQAASEAFRRLDELDPKSIGASQDNDLNGEPCGVPFLRFGEEALEIFVEWRTELERRLRSGELHPALESHLAKYRKLIPSLAVLFHIADGGSGAVTDASLVRALAWAPYLESHARRIYESGPASEAAAARAILARVRKDDLKHTFSGWQVWRPGWSGLTDREIVFQALAMLVDLGYLIVHRVVTGGREATQYTVNPKALT